MRDADGVGDVAGVLDILAGAAGAFAVDGLAVVVELERDAHDLQTGLEQQCCGDGTVDAAGHGNDHPGAGLQRQALGG